MKTLQKMIAGAAIIGATMLGYNASAQSKLVPTKVSTETSIISNKDVSGIPMQRIEAGNDAWSFKYDYNSQLNNESKPSDVGMFALNKLYSKNNTTVGAEIFPVGNYDKDHIWFVDAWVAKKFGDISVMLDYGKGFQKDKHSKDYIIGKLNHPKFSLEGCVYPQGSIFEKGIEWKNYGLISYKGDHAYASLGNKINTTYASAGVYGFEDIGELVFGNFNRKTGDVWIKSQTAFGDVSKGFYSEKTFEMASEYFAMPAYFPIHFSPLSTKGNVALKLEYKKTPSKGTQESEIMIGSAKTPFVQLGVGVNTEYCECAKPVSDVAIELYKDFKFGNFAGSIEGRYNNRTHTGTGYVKLCYNIGGK